MSETKIIQACGRQFTATYGQDGLLEVIYPIAGRDFIIREFTEEEFDKYTEILFRNTAQSQEAALQLLENLDNDQVPPETPANTKFIHEQIKMILAHPRDGGSIPQPAELARRMSYRQRSEIIDIQSELCNLPEWLASFESSLKAARQTKMMKEANSIPVPAPTGTKSADQLLESMGRSQRKSARLSPVGKS